MKYLKIALLTLAIVYSSFANAISIPDIPVPGAWGGAPLGTPVYDLTAAGHAASIIQNGLSQIEYYKQMIEELGNGKLTPSSINFLSGLYSNCVGKKYVLPEFMPDINLDICSKDADTKLTGYYNDHIIIQLDDTPEKVYKKKRETREAIKALRKSLLATSAKQIEYHAQKDYNTIDTIQRDIKISTTQIDYLKLQAQIQVQILQELQDIKTNQALMMQAMALRE